MPQTIVSVKPQWKWHYGVLLGLRDRLLKEKSQHLEEAAQPLENHSMNIADSATDEFDHDLAWGKLSAEQDALYEVEDAIRRIFDDTYGVCQETGKPIPASRLKAVPWTRFSRETEARLEKAGTIQRPHLGNVASVYERNVDSE